VDLGSYADFAVSTAQMVWQPDVWAKALRATKLTSFRLCRTKDECESVCSQQPG